MGGGWWAGQLLEPAKPHGPEGTSTWAESQGFLVPWKVWTTALGTIMSWWGPLGHPACQGYLSVSVPQAGTTLVGKSGVWEGVRFVPVCSDLPWV